MSSEHIKFHFSVTCHTNDLAVLHCLRALAQYAQQEGNKRIPWGGTKEKDWEQDRHRVAFHFTKPEYRNLFVHEAQRLLAKGCWTEVERSDNQPASPQHSNW